MSNNNYNDYNNQYTNNYDNNGYYDNEYAGNYYDNSQPYGVQPTTTKSKTNLVAIIVPVVAVVLVAAMVIASIFVINSKKDSPTNLSGNQIESLILQDVDDRTPEDAPELVGDFIDKTDMDCGRMKKCDDGRYRIPIDMQSPDARDICVEYFEGNTYNTTNNTTEGSYFTDEQLKALYDLLGTEDLETIKSEIYAYYNPDTDMIEYDDDFWNAILGNSEDILEENLDEETLPENNEGKTVTELMEEVGIDDTDDDDDEDYTEDEDVDANDGYADENYVDDTEDDTEYDTTESYADTDDDTNDSDYEEDEDDSNTDETEINDDLDASLEILNDVVNELS